MAVEAPANGEAYWLLPPNSVHFTLRQHSTTRKELFMYPEDNISNLRKSKKERFELTLFTATTSIYHPHSDSSDLIIRIQF